MRTRHPVIRSLRIGQRTLFGVVFFLIALGLYVALISYDTLYQSSRPKTYYLSLDGIPTLKEDNLTFIVDNNKNNSQLVHVYRLSATELKIDITDFTDKLGNILNKKDINHKVIKKENPIIINISAVSKVSGSFNGWIIISNDKGSFSIPVTLQTEPMKYIAILWILVGVISAIGFWEFYRHFDLETTKSTLDKPVPPLEGESGTNELEAASAKLEVKSAKLSHRYKTPHSSLKIISLQLGAIGLGVIAGLRC